MVQYRLNLRGELAYRRDNDPDHFWKLETAAYLKDARLQEEFFRLKLYRNPRLNRERKVELYARTQRGFLPYDVYSLAELKAFARERKIPLPHGRLSASLLICQLERADDDATFPRFSDLPPELRQLVFEWYFVSIAKERTLLIFKQPPVTRVSRLFRHEALPLLYRLCTFELEIMTCQSFPQDLYRVKKRPACVLEGHSHDFIENISMANIQLIKRLAITVQLFSFQQCVRLILDFEGEGSVSVQNASLQPGDERVPHRLADKLDVVVKRVAERKEVHKLKKTDVGRLLGAVDRALRKWEPW